MIPNTNIAKVATRRISETAASLEPSALITLYEVDISEILQGGQRVVSFENTPQDPLKPFRFHNNVKLIDSSIYWGGEEYYAAPINTSGFEMSAKGSPPKPKLTITANFDNLPQDTADRIRYIKAAIRDLDSLCGAKVTRIRTFAKYLDCENFYSDCVNSISGPGTTPWSNVLPVPEGFVPDSSNQYASFPPDIYFIDRKSGENKNTVEFELASPFDLQDLKLPARLVTENTCTWVYRGEGCCYEYESIKKTGSGEAHETTPEGDCKQTPMGGDNKHRTAPPVSNGLDEVFGVGDLPSLLLPNDDGTPPVWSNTVSYVVGNIVRVELKGVNYYFVCKTAHGGNVSTGHAPPDSRYWVADECSKTLAGCRLRWSSPLPMGAFPTSRRGASE